MAEKFTTKRIDSLSADRVSVIIPAYCVAPYIGETLKSVFAQTKPAFEVIVINDGSPDTEKLEQILQAFPDRIVYLKQKNRGTFWSAQHGYPYSQRKSDRPTRWR